jgi:ABC-type lipoprotein export system ATPase subunit
MVFTDEDHGQVALRLRGVSRAYRSPVEVVWAAREVDLSIPAGGRLVCVYGASGSGKSTLLRLISGLDQPESGQIFVDGHDLGELSTDDRAGLRRTVLGVIFQEPNLIEEFTAVENVALPLEASGVDTSQALAQAGIALKVVGLAGLEHRFPRQLSGGQQQRVGIARALVGDRTVLLADEPTGALDSVNSLAIFGLLRELSDGGITVIVCSHDPRCRPFADALYEMIDGRLLARDPVEVPTGRPSG